MVTQVSVGYQGSIVFIPCQRVPVGQYIHVSSPRAEGWIEFSGGLDLALELGFGDSCMRLMSLLVALLAHCSTWFWEEGRGQPNHLLTCSRNEYGKWMNMNMEQWDRHSPNQLGHTDQISPRYSFPNGRHISLLWKRRFAYGGTPLDLSQNSYTLQRSLVSLLGKK